eukprot:CAMPEP_0185773728 /NCGR_PEP_ID=MMETSP1174-20130828/74804_1 /TAXON_ID=35687 /ORGANISM="Dictyocha speculum, Strain CCMP1381" /LENGTH=122 /DNA_ID=CAMNT_0028460525 /DNA_START=239 /DNA_END=603 /DNA_ORIENTATION=-
MSDVEEAVEVAFLEVEKRSRVTSNGVSSDATATERQDVARQVAAALGVQDDGTSKEMTSETLRTIQTLSEQASLAYVQAREWLDSAKLYVEDRARRDAAVLVATIEYVRRRVILDSRRVLAA